MEGSCCTTSHKDHMCVHSWLAIGGKDSDNKSTTAVHMYNPTTDSWEVISHMGTPRWGCVAAAIPNNQLMVVGIMEIDSVEFATLE